MKKRSLLSLVLAGALCLGGPRPALAAGETAPAVADQPPHQAADSGADQALLAVTSKVKATLGLDTEVFTDFQGWSDEDALLGRRWRLEWTGDGVSLSVTADDTGKIYSYSRSQSALQGEVSTPSLGGGLNIPRLPQDQSSQARTAAQDFLNKVLTQGVETAELESPSSPSLTQTNYRFSGQILLNGLTSPISYSVTVRASDLQVTRFWRGDQSSGYLGTLPGASAQVSPQDARTSLASTVDMECRYVLTDDGKTARVRWVPLEGDEYYVDGQTGQLVDLTELQRQLWRGQTANGAVKFMSSMKDAAPEMAQDAGGLTQAEREGAAVLEGALDKAALDAGVKAAWPQIGLSNYTLSAASYSVSKRTGQEEETVTCTLTYGRQQGEVLQNKFLTVDAKTGRLQSLFSHRSYRGEGEDALARQTDLAQGEVTAESALQTFAGDHFSQLDLFSKVDAQTQESWQHLYTYQQKANGYFYAGNAYTVGIDATDGTLSRLSGSFDDQVILLVPDQVISKAQAVSAYAAALDLPYGYIEVPVSVSLAGPDVEPLLKEAGYDFVLSLKPGYALSQPQDGQVQGVDAETGEPVVRPRETGEERAITYDDLANHWVQSAAQTLAAFGVGLRGGSLKPAQALTQLDALALLTSLTGYVYDPAAATQEETDRLYNYAYSLGLCAPETRGESRTLTRGELIKLILDAAGYERVAALEGIYRCDYTDAASIDPHQLGYAALAQGLGLVKGGPDGAYAGGRTATRAEAVAMLYQFMR